MFPCYFLALLLSLLFVLLPSPCLALTFSLSLTLSLSLVSQERRAELTQAHTELAKCVAHLQALERDNHRATGDARALEQQNARLTRELAAHVARADAQQQHAQVTQTSAMQWCRAVFMAFV